MAFNKFLSTSQVGLDLGLDIYPLREDSFIDFVWRNVPGMFLLDPTPLLEKR